MIKIYTSNWGKVALAYITKTSNQTKKFNNLKENVYNLYRRNKLIKKKNLPMKRQGIWKDNSQLIKSNGINLS
jgi:hypothetical protein